MHGGGRTVLVCQGCRRIYSLGRTSTRLLESDTGSMCMLPVWLFISYWPDQVFAVVSVHFYPSVRFPVSWVELYQFSCSSHFCSDVCPNEEWCTMCAYSVTNAHSGEISRALVVFTVSNLNGCSRHLWNVDDGRKPACYPTVIAYELRSRCLT